MAVRLGALELEKRHYLCAPCGEVQILREDRAVVDLPPVQQEA